MTTYVSSVQLHPLDGPPAIVGVDPATGFIALRDDDTLGISIEIGRFKNVNKNPVSEKAIAEVEEELVRQVPNGGPVAHLSLTIAIARLNSLLRRHGVSAQ